MLLLLLLLLRTFAVCCCSAMLLLLRTFAVYFMRAVLSLMVMPRSRSMSMLSMNWSCKAEKAQHSTCQLQLSICEWALQAQTAPSVASADDCKCSGETLA
jgi:hypothetical protein